MNQYCACIRYYYSHRLAKSPKIQNGNKYVYIGDDCLYLFAGHIVCSYLINLLYSTRSSKIKINEYKFQALPEYTHCT